MAGLYDSSENFDLNSVSVPVTGIAAFNPTITSAGVVPDTDMGSKTLDLGKLHYLRLGLYKQDGGVEEGRNDEDPMEFFQEGEKLAGASQRTIKIGLAEDNANVDRLTEGKTPDSNGVIYVDASLPDAKFLLFVATKYKNGTERRRNGVARISAIEVDQEERGSVRAKSVTFEWVPDPLFNDSPYKQWVGVPGGVTIDISQKTASVKVNETLQLNATVSPSSQRVTWKSADPLTAKVEGGLVTGVKAGGPIAITAEAGGKSATCQVTVTGA